jgi:signal transduction histidine kinase
VESAQLEAVRKAVTIEAAVDPTLLVLGDAGALTEALLNVVGNAVKYSRADGTVQVTAERQGKRILVSVADTGVGMPPEDLPRIFDVFYRGLAGENVAAGAGIGLALTRRIVEAHGGSISATSQPGHGSVFVIALPAHDASAAEPGAKPPQQVPKGVVG